MSTVSELKNVVVETTLEYDWKKYERLGRAFLKSASSIGKFYGEKVVLHQVKINEIANKLREGKIRASSARRAIARHKVSIKTYLNAAGEAMKWETAESYWESVDDLINFLLLIASAVIKAL